MWMIINNSLGAKVVKISLVILLQICHQFFIFAHLIFGPFFGQIIWQMRFLYSKFVELEQHQQSQVGS